MNDEAEELVLSLLNAGSHSSAAAEATAAAAAAALAAQRADRSSNTGRPPSSPAPPGPCPGPKPGTARATQQQQQQPDVEVTTGTPLNPARGGSGSRRPSDPSGCTSREHQLISVAAHDGGDTLPRALSAALPGQQPSYDSASARPMPPFEDGDPTAPPLPGAAPVSPKPFRRSAPPVACEHAPEVFIERLERPPLPPHLSVLHQTSPAASLRPALRRGSNSSVGGDSIGGGGGAVGPGPAGFVNGDGDRSSNPERRILMPTSGSVVSDATATPLSGTRRSSLTGGAGGAVLPREREPPPAAQLRSPARAVSWQHPQQQDKQQQQQQNSSPHQQHRKQQQQQQQQQQHVTQQQHSTLGRAVRFSSRDGTPGVASELGAGLWPAGNGLPPAGPTSMGLPPLRRTSESSSVSTACQGQGPQHDGGTAVARTAAPGPVQGRPSDDGGAAAGRRTGPASIPDGASGGQGKGPESSPRGGERDPQDASPGALEATGAGTVPPGVVQAPAGGEDTRSQRDGGSRRSTGTGLAGPQGSSSGPIRRAKELSPLSLPPGMDTALREALARAAAQNVALLGTGALLPEPDFGYARIVAQHHHKQQQQQQEQHQQHPKRHDSSVPHTPSPPEPPTRRRSLQVIEPAGGGPAAQSGGGDDDSASSPPSPRKHKTFTPQLAGRSMRSVLKSSTQPGEYGGPGQQQQQQPAEPAPAKFPSSNSNHSSRSLLRRRSSACSIEGSGAGTGTGTDPDSPPVAAMRGAFAAGGGGGGAGGVLLAGGAEGSLDGLAADLLNEENVDVRIHCLTFNMGGVAPTAAALPESLFSGSYLSPDSNADAAHIYVMSTQESGPLAEWEAAVALHLGRRYRRVAAESLMSIHILIFAVHHLVPYIVDVRTSSVATGVGNVLGNKGGVAVTFGLLGAQVLLVGAHFAAHDQNVERRNADFHRICAGLFAPPAAASPATTAANGAAANGSTLPQPQQSLQGRPPESPTMTGQAGRNGTATRRYYIGSGPTLSRFSRGSNHNHNHSNQSNSGGAASDSDRSVGGPAPSRALTRTLSSSSVSSAVSTVSRPPSEAPSRSRSPSFWSGISFATAQRQSNALLTHFDVVLWMGDLNYRIAGNPEVVKYAIDHNMVEVLRANDQLANQQKKGKVLQGFQEMPIAFAPTYKFAPGTDDYDLRRTPAWCDRVLYLVNADPLFADLRPLYYMSVPELRTSDHKPVIAGFELSISPQHAGANHHARHKACVIS